MPAPIVPLLAAVGSHLARQGLAGATARYLLPALAEEAATKGLAAYAARQGMNGNAVENLADTGTMARRAIPVINGLANANIAKLPVKAATQLLADLTANTVSPNIAYANTSNTAPWQYTGLAKFTDTLNPVMQRELALKRNGNVRDWSNFYNTPLGKFQDEYNRWYSKNSNDSRVNARNYDLQGWWLENRNRLGTWDVPLPDPNVDRGHFTDLYKKPNHPTFSTYSKYNGVDGFYGGEWKNNNKDYYAHWSNVLSDSDLAEYMANAEPNSRLMLSSDRAFAPSNESAILNFLGRLARQTPKKQDVVYDPRTFGIGIRG